MSFAVILDCLDMMEVIDASETPTGLIPWVMFPLDDDNSIDAGDEMTCIVCNKTQTVVHVGKESRESPDPL